MYEVIPMLLLAQVKGKGGFVSSATTSRLVSRLLAIDRKYQHSSGLVKYGSNKNTARENENRISNSVFNVLRKREIKIRK